MSRTTAFVLLLLDVVFAAGATRSVLRSDMPGFVRSVLAAAFAGVGGMCVVLVLVAAVTT